MKSLLSIIALVLSVGSLVAQTQPSQEKVEAQGSLTLGKSQERTLAPKTVHVWSIALEKNQYASVEVLQKGIDVVTHIVNPDSIRKGQFDSPKGTFGKEKAAWISESSGIWKIEIVPLEARRPGIYEIKWAVLHSATEKDKQSLEADSLGNLALDYYVKGKYAKAESLCVRSLAIREAILGPNHPEVADSFHDLAEVYRNQAKDSQAESLFKKSLMIREKTEGPEHPDLAQTFNNLGLLYKDQAKYPQADSLYRRALKIAEKFLGPRHPDFATMINNIASLYMAQDRFSDADSLFRLSLDIREKALGPDHPDVAQSLNNLAFLYKTKGKYDQAEPLYKRSLAIRVKTRGANHPTVATAISNLAGLYNDIGKYSMADSLYKQALIIREKTLTPDHPDIALTLNNLAGIYKTQSRYAEAESLYSRSLLIFKKKYGNEHPVVATGLNNLAFLYKELGKYKEAEEFHKQSLAIQQKVLKPDHTDMAASLNNLGLLYFELAKYTVAESLFKRSFEIRKNALGAKHPLVAQSLGNSGAIYRELADYAKAEQSFKDAMKIREQVLGQNHPDLASNLGNLATLYLDQGKYSEAESLFTRSIAILQRALDQDHPDVAQKLNQLAVLYRDQGRFNKADSLYERAQKILLKYFGETHPRVATNFNNWAVLKQQQSKYSEAEALFKRSLVIRMNTLGSDHPDVANSLNNLAALYYALGRYAEAAQTYKHSLSIWEKVVGTEHPSFAKTLNNLGVLYRDQGQYEDAEVAHKKSLTIREKIFGKEHPTVAYSLQNLAIVYREQSKYAEAESLYKRSLAIREKFLGLEHPDVAFSLTNLANLFIAQGKYAEAELLHRRALNIRQKSLGKDHPDVANSLYNLAQTLSHQGRNKSDTSLVLLQRAIAILDATPAYPYWRLAAYGLRAQLLKKSGDSRVAISDLAEALRSVESFRPQIGGGEEMRAGFFEKYTDYFNRIVAWQLEAGQIDKAFEYAEKGRARVLLDQMATARIDLRSNIPADIRTSLEKQETDAKARMAEYQQRLTLQCSRRDISDEQKKQEITELTEVLRTAERDYQQVYEAIKQASPLWRDLITSGGQLIDLATIQSRLIPANDLMLLYQIGKEESFLFVIPPSGQKPEAMSLQVTNEAAAILKVDAGPLKSTDLQRILLGQSENESIGGLLQYLNSPSVETTPSKTASTKLYALWQVLIPERLWPQLVNVTEVIIIPDGVLHLFPFEALVVRNDATPSKIRYWLDEGPVIRYAPSATTLYNVEQRPAVPVNPSSNQAFVLSLSDPIFDPMKVNEELLKQSATRLTASRDSALVNQNETDSTFISVAISENFERAGKALIRLRGTARETEAIRKAFASSESKNGVLTLMQLEATEPKLRAELSGKRYIHLATHGVVDQQRSTLFAALALTPPPTATTVAEDDGFLQLYEIYDLKLPDCELAVLSACETNFGRHFEGEGVFALSRGFLVAGARRVIASQWSVDDVSTAKLIGAFFRQVATAEKAGQKIDYARVLRDAKLTVRNKEEWAEPYFWAPFVLIGKR